MALISTAASFAPEPELLSIDNSRKITGISRSQTYAWLNNNTIQGVKIGTRTFVVAASIREAIRNLPRYR